MPCSDFTVACTARKFAGRQRIRGGVREGCPARGQRSLLPVGSDADPQQRGLDARSEARLTPPVEAVGAMPDVVGAGVGYG